MTYRILRTFHCIDTQSINNLLLEEGGKILLVDTDNLLTFEEDEESNSLAYYFSEKEIQTLIEGKYIKPIKET